jgi:hypothetical protein
MPDKMLFHYCSLETAIEYILPNKQLRISPLIKTNDPRENESLLFGTLNKFDALSADDILKMNESVSKAIREDCKVLCFSEDSDHLDGYQLSQMWALYGGRHKGVCIGINLAKFIEENRCYIKDGLFKPVKYFSPKDLKRTIFTERYKYVDITRLDHEPGYLKNGFRVEYLDYLFFSKSIEWQHEQEFRLISFSDKIEDEFCSIKNSLSHVVLGIDFNMKYLPSIKHVLDDHMCPIWELKYFGEWLACSKNLNE